MLCVGSQIKLFRVRMYEASHDPTMGRVAAALRPPLVTRRGFAHRPSHAATGPHPPSQSTD